MQPSEKLEGDSTSENLSKVVGCFNRFTMTRCFVYAVLVLVCVMLTHCSAQKTSCTGRCGGSYYRGDLCHCDYNCLIHDECCQDYEAKCTTSGSCKGRCGESFKRGRQCDCDPECKNFNKCCPDYTQFCSPEEATIKPANSAAVGPNPCINTHANKPADPPMPQDSVQTESEDKHEGNPDSVISPTSPPHEEQPVPLAPENEIIGESDTPDESALSEGTSGLEPLATSAPESPVPTIVVVTPVTSVAGDAEAALDAELREEGLSLDDATPPVPDPTSPPSPSPASQNPTAQSPGEYTTQSPLNSSDSVTALASTPASEGEDQTSTTQSTASEPTSNPASKEQEAANTTASAASGPTTAPPKMATTPAESPAPTQASVPPSEEPDAQKKPDESAASTEAPAAFTEAPAASTEAPAASNATTAPPKAQDASVNTATPSAKVQDATASKPPPAASTAMPTDLAQDTKPQSLATQRPSATSLAPAGTTKPVEMTTKPLASTAKPVEKTTKAPKATPPPSKPTKKPEKPSSVNDIEFPAVDNSRDYQSDDSNDTNLCSGRPISGLTTLRNGTTVVFRGHYFWMLDARRVPGPAQGITDVWGIPSPIDTVFTRCNCQGKTYFLKGQYYWRFENDVRDTGYPKTIHKGFDGLSGHITAALSVPAYMRRRESVYFFKRGGKVQKYSYDPKKAPRCGNQPTPRVHYTVYSVRQARQAETYLGRELSIMANWKGFPTTVTSAVSIPSRQARDGYDYYVFSRTRHYKVSMDAERPTLTIPIHTTQAQRPQKSFFNCPQTTSA